MYTFTKLHISVHIYGCKMKFSAKNKEKTDAVNSTTWQFFNLLQNLAIVG